MYLNRNNLVYPKYHLGNIKKKHLAEMAFSKQQQDFGFGKQKDLTGYCRKCEFLFACNGECPKNRFIKTPIGEPGLNYLCSGLKKYFSHIKPHMDDMARQVKAQQGV